jgi:hypothetical protein
LDPVVASKVHFTNNTKEMEEFVPGDKILKELEGNEDWVYRYVEPIPGENDKMKDTATRDRLLAAREEAVKEYEEVTLQWLKDPESENGVKAMAERNSIATRLKDNYWALDPYIRARSLYDRTGVIQPGGMLKFYPATDKELNAAVPPQENGTAAVETSTDDVD